MNFKDYWDVKKEHLDDFPNVDKQLLENLARDAWNCCLDRDDIQVVRRKPVQRNELKKLVLTRRNFKRGIPRSLPFEDVQLECFPRCVTYRYVTQFDFIAFKDDDGRVKAFKDTRTASALIVLNKSTIYSTVRKNMERAETVFVIEHGGLRLLKSRRDVELLKDYNQIYPADKETVKQVFSSEEPKSMLRSGHVTED